MPARLLDSRILEHLLLEILEVGVARPGLQGAPAPDLPLEQLAQLAKPGHCPPLSSARSRPASPSSLSSHSSVCSCFIRLPPLSSSSAYPIPRAFHYDALNQILTCSFRDWLSYAHCLSMLKRRKLTDTF